MSGPLASRMTRPLLMGMIALLCACAPDDKQRWDEFWKIENSGLSWARKAGDVETWTIECNEYKGDRHRRTADTLAASLKRVEGLDANQVRVEHETDRSRIYYGAYDLRYVEAQGDGPDRVRGEVVIELNDAIRRDMALIRGLAVGNQYPFFTARAIAMPVPATGPAEWDLRNAKGRYTLHVGVTYNTPTLHNHQEAAVEWVRALRADGYEAYCYHDPQQGRSDICVGTFGDDALVDTGGGRTGPSPAVKALQKKADFAYNLENGHRVYRISTDESGRKVRIPNWSFLVRIERGGGSLAPMSP
jgi:hypothetical protein